MFLLGLRIGGTFLRASLFALFIIVTLVLAFPWPERPVISRWSGAQTVFAGASSMIATATSSDQPAAIVGLAAPQPLDLAEYHQASRLLDASPGQSVNYYQRDLPGGGMIAYFLVELSSQVHIEVINADGATPGSDTTGDTIWTDGQRHLASVADMAQAPYAAREGMTLLGAMAFGFHGDVRTSDEGSVVINGVVHRANPRRAALCITRDGRAEIGRFEANALANCEQAIGAGPVILWQGKVANPDLTAETDLFVPFNPLGEDFALLNWRRMIYSGTYPKSVIGVGQQANGQSYLVLATSYGVAGVDLAGALKAMGCTAALGGDDDTSTQAVWRGAPVRAGQVRSVPDAVAVYVRE